MSLETNPALRRSVIYELYVRSHTPQGTFRAVEPDLPRIRALGTDILWLMPIHPIGEANRKGSMGCPYANRDYRTVNPEYGTLEDFLHLVDAIHDNGMKCIIDVVYNHTSPDATLVALHPEYYYHKPDGSRGNKVGDWTDVVDLDYAVPGLWDYQIESLCYWAQYVDGFRCDVASTVPVAFWRKARQAVERVRPGAIWLGESVHLDHILAFRRQGFYAATDNELFDVFDILYPYDIWPLYEGATGGTMPLSRYFAALSYQELSFPTWYNKLSCLENHDQRRAADRFPNRDSLLAWMALGPPCSMPGRRFLPSIRPPCLSGRASTGPERTCPPCCGSCTTSKSACPRTPPSMWRPTTSRAWPWPTTGTANTWRWACSPWRADRGRPSSPWPTAAMKTP